MGNSKSQPPIWIQLRPEDNVGVLVRSVKAGLPIDLNGTETVFDKDLGLGHKVALQPIKHGEKIFKYGFPIGSASRDIDSGEHVHLHNLASDYLPTHTWKGGPNHE